MSNVKALPDPQSVITPASKEALEEFLALPLAGVAIVGVDHRGVVHRRSSGLDTLKLLGAIRSAEHQIIESWKDA